MFARAFSRGSRQISHRRNPRRRRICRTSARPQDPAFPYAEAAAGPGFSVARAALSFFSWVLKTSSLDPECGT